MLVLGLPRSVSRNQPIHSVRSARLLVNRHMMPGRERRPQLS